MKVLEIYKCTISSSINNVGKVVDDIINCLADCFTCVDDTSLFDIRVILNELCLNAVKHGNKEDESKDVRVAVRIVNGCNLMIVIEDQGEGYNHDSVSETSVHLIDELDACELKESGRGILIVSCLCDKLKVNAKGNKVTVLKKLHKDVLTQKLRNSDLK